ncbi:hypothetical protein RhiirC2_764361 [Rhizophagus irregularis]|uniref:Uncharacterized protein n=1 Tax=Rhizophagus irregularis TaxID=588596 RepID=A0A2N1M469_9GLOM|nr:hypothetical protein RhiirC2_764361 [Rhizophagus irregularis]
MSDTNITLKCLIVPIGHFRIFSLKDLSLKITLPRDGLVSTIQTAIQDQLAPSLKNYPFDIRKVYFSASEEDGGERRMRVDTEISAYFEAIIPEGSFHIVAYPIPPPPSR